MRLSGPTWIWIAAALYLASAFVHVPSDPTTVIGTPHVWIGPIALAPPRALSGDSPHYLVAVNSLLEDRDFDLANNYRAAEKGDWDLGARFRRRVLDRHVDELPDGRQIGTHSPFFPMILAVVAFPFVGTIWVETAAILLNLAVAVLGLGLFLKCSRQRGWGVDPDRCVLWLAFATAYWCYSRDLWTEVWIVAIWLGLLLARNPWARSALAILGILIKVPFAVVPATIGLLALRRRRNSPRWNSIPGCDPKTDPAWPLLASTAAALLTAIAIIQYLFRGSDHFSVFHSGVHAGFGLPFAGSIGLLLDPENGLLFFSPFLAWGLWRFREGGERYLPAIAFFLVHASYSDWMGGTGFSARYLVPMLPILVWAVAEAKPRGWIFKAALAYSLFWGCFAGMFPALVYDRSPWDVAAHVLKKLAPPAPPIAPPLDGSVP